jgi:hypothetical protein
MSHRFYGFAVLACCSALALSMSSPTTATPTAQDKGAMSEDFVDNLKDFNKSVEKIVIEVGNIAALKDKIRKARPGMAAAEIKEEKHQIEKINDNLEEVKRTLKNLESAAKSADEKIVTKAAGLTGTWALRFANMTIRAQYDYNLRWAAFYEKLLGVMTADMKRSTKEKKFSPITCTICTGGYIDCPACEGKGTCGAQVWSDEKCKDGVFHAANTRLCPVCGGTSACLFCEGQGKMLCPIEHRILSRR